MFLGVAVVGGAVLCATGVGSVVGVGLIVGGTSGLISNTMDACGVESKLASQISAGIDIVGGTALCFTPFAPIGASMIGSGVGSFAGGYISEGLGGSYELGATIGNIGGGIAGGEVYNGLKNLGAIAFKAPTSKIMYNPTDPYITLGPKQGEVVNKIRSIQSKGIYNPLSVTRLPGGYFQLADGHHTFRALQSLGYKYAWMKFVK